MVACGVCGEENPARARFSLGCGTPLAAAARRWRPAGRAEATARSAQPAEEGAHVADEQVGGFHGGEVAAAVEL
jgi:hypothetical protein